MIYCLKKLFVEIVHNKKTCLNFLNIVITAIIEKLGLLLTLLFLKHSWLETIMAGKKEIFLLKQKIQQELLI
jgi:hypothetical protein